MLKSKFFNLGMVVATKGINEVMLKNQKFALEVCLCLQRYCLKDWGDLSEEDKQANEDALQYPDDLFILASYQTCEGKIWIITNPISEISGNATTICFPSER